MAFEPKIYSSLMHDVICLNGCSQLFREGLLSNFEIVIKEFFYCMLTTLLQPGLKFSGPPPFVSGWPPPFPSGPPVSEG